MLTNPEEEAAARALLHNHVADVHAPEEMLEPVQAKARKRQAVRRTGYAVGTVALAGCAAALIPTGLFSPAAGPRALPGGASVSVVTGENHCPARHADYLESGAKPVGVVPDYMHTLVPGQPIAAISCPLEGSGPVAVPLSATQLAEAVSVLNAMTPGSEEIINGPCRSSLAKNGDLYLVFEYPNGARLTITAFGSRPCDNETQTDVTWWASNTAAGGSTTTPAQAGTFEALAELR